MLTSQSLTSFAIIEYNRDAGFRKLVDACVAELQESGAIPKGTPLRAILEEEGADGIPRAKALLEAHHGSTGEPQWKRARDGLKTS